MKYFYFLLFWMQGYSLHAQKASDTFAIKKVFLGHQYAMPPQKISYAKMRSILFTVSEAKQYWQKYSLEKWSGTGSIAVGLGYFFLSRPKDTDRNNQIKAIRNTMISNVFVALGTYLVIHSYKQLYRSVKAYNKSKRMVVN